MLILTRKEGECILIGDDITVKVLENRGGNGIKIGIAAPTDVRVDREEVRERIKAEKEGLRKPRQIKADI